MEGPKQYYCHPFKEEKIKARHRLREIREHGNHEI